MKKRVLYSILSLIIILIVIIVSSYLYDKKIYTPINKTKSKHYEIIKVEIPESFGFIDYQTHSKGLLDTSKYYYSEEDRPDVNRNIYSNYTPTGYIYLDVKTLNFIVNFRPNIKYDSTGHRIETNTEVISHAVINSSGEIIKKINQEEARSNLVIDTTGYLLTNYLNHKGVKDTIYNTYIKENSLFKNSILLKTELNTNINRKDKKNPIYLTNFLNKHNFNSNCYNPFRDYMNSTGYKTRCNVWKGDGYYKLKYNNEILRFIVPSTLQSYFLFTDKTTFFYPEMEYYIPPKKYQEALGNMAIIVVNNSIYFVKEKE